MKSYQATFKQEKLLELRCILITWCKKHLTSKENSPTLIWKIERAESCLEMEHCITFGNHWARWNILWLNIKTSVREFHRVIPAAAEARACSGCEILQCRALQRMCKYIVQNMIHVVSSLMVNRGLVLLLAQVLTRVDSAYAPSPQFIHQGPR